MDRKELMKGMCAPTVIGMILSAGGVLGAKDAASRRQMIISSLVSVLILWTLCYYGYVKSAWVFLLLPLILMGPLIALMIGVAVGSGELRK